MGRRAQLAEMSKGSRETRQGLRASVTTPHLVDIPTPGLVGRNRIGTVLHQTYRIERLIAEGGMGSVYEVQHLRLQQRFALKVLEHQAARNDEAYARFRQEAEIAASLNHASIVQVFDFNTDALGNPYMVMEFVEGTTLSDFINGKPMTVRDVVRVMEPLCSALDAAHKAGIVHRDLKPSNLMIRRSSSGCIEVKLLDFGISKMKAADDGKTRDNVVMGTPNYMSPEQARGHASSAEATTDIFALGAIMYEALTGRRAFDGQSTPELLHMIVYEEPLRLKVVRPELPTGLCEVVERCLSKAPTDRFSSVRDLAVALRDAVRPTSRGKEQPSLALEVPRPPAETRRRPVLWATVWMLSVVATAVVAALIVSKPQGRVEEADSRAMDSPVATDEAPPSEPVLLPVEFPTALATPGAKLMVVGSSLYRADARGISYWPDPETPPVNAALPSSGAVSALARTHDGSILVGQDDGTVSAWPKTLERPEWSHRVGKEAAELLAAGADYLVVSNQNAIELYNYRHWRLLKRFSVSSPPVALLLVTAPKARLIVVYSERIELVDLDHRKIIASSEISGRVTDGRIAAVTVTGPLEIELDFDQGDWNTRRRFRLLEGRKGTLELAALGTVRL